MSAHGAHRAAASRRVEHAWAVLHGVLDPEVPAISVRDLGIVRDVIDHGDALEVVADADLFRLPGDRGHRAERVATRSTPPASARRA